jgi:LAO/AO transport system kinase
MDRAIRDRILSGDVRAIARVISWLENGDPEGIETLRSIGTRCGRAHIIGITGPPGSGKSTLTDKMIGILRSRGAKVAVLAVDPSSPFTGGAILGDRLRMQPHATDPGVFIRSLASRGALGGVSRATTAACKVLDAAGYDFVIVETVGVGQSEIDIVKIADTVVLVSVPGLGDDIQVIKAGIMEIGDIFVVNKADKDGADRVVREIRAMLETAAMLGLGRAPRTVPDTLSTHIPFVGHHGAANSGADGDSSPDRGSGRAMPELPPVLKMSAELGQGVAELVDACVAHRVALESRGELARRRSESVRAEIRGILARRLFAALEAPEERKTEDRLVDAVVGRGMDVYDAAEALFEAAFAGGKP